MPNSKKYAQNRGRTLFLSTLLIYEKVAYFTRVHSLQSIIQIMDQALKRTATHQLQALGACPRGWLQVLGLGRLLSGVPMKDPPVGAGPGGPDARPGSAARPPSAPDPVFDLGDRRAPRVSLSLMCSVNTSVGR